MKILEIEMGKVEKVFSPIINDVLYLIFIKPSGDFEAYSRKVSSKDDLSVIYTQIDILHTLVNTEVLMCLPNGFSQIESLPPAEFKTTEELTNHLDVAVETLVHLILAQKLLDMESGARSFTQFYDNFLYNQFCLNHRMFYRNCEPGKITEVDHVTEVSRVLLLETDGVFKIEVSGKVLPTVVYFMLRSPEDVLFSINEQTNELLIFVLQNEEDEEDENALQKIELDYGNFYRIETESDYEKFLSMWKDTQVEFPTFEKLLKYYTQLPTWLCFEDIEYDEWQEIQTAVLVTPQILAEKKKKYEKELAEMKKTLQALEALNCDQKED